MNNEIKVYKLHKLHIYYIKFICLAFISAKFSNHVIKIFKIFPGWCGSVDWVLACEQKGHWFDSWLGHMPGLWARFPDGSVVSRTSMFLSLSFSLFSPLFKNK